ncbi:lysine methyltransferase 5Ab [Myxocyprinus asiaticus]|uniref:lysine methyltransferase 5Ab n=1 Tax=Myxocyprinus asiaticus TaxID=70543 RepID=UPI00222211D1|nr:lysine methyltransferase 5Ab [Myxocyprinus asiaticus]
MGKGKLKTSTFAKRRLDNVKEAKENKHEKSMTCQGQSTIHSCLNPSKLRAPLRNSPLAPIHEDNSVTSSSPNNTSKPSEGKGTSELKAPKQKNTGKQIQWDPICGSNVQTAVLHEDSEITKQTKSGPGSNSKKSTSRKLKGKDSEHNRKVTDYYPIRRSCRKSKAELKCEKQQHIDDLITNNVEVGLKVKHIEGKGRGVFADREFQKGQFVVEYHGDLLEIDDAKERESQYAQDPTTGCYMYYFRYLDKTYCVDATKETNRLGRLINHSKNGNLQTKIHDINGIPHLILLASRDIEVDEELLYDYGDRSKEAIAAHPWLKH